MALTKTLLPSLAPTIVMPYDTLQAFCLSQVIVATGYASNVNTQLTMGPGRYNGLWAMNVAAVNMGSANEFYQMFLLGSNDPTFTAGNIEILATHDIAATAALRLLATICAVSPTVPDTGLTASVFVKPWCNQIDQYIFEYLQLYVVVGGTSPSITLTSWCSYNSMHQA